MTEAELKALSKSVEDELDERCKQEFQRTARTKEELLKVYSGYGYIVPEDAKFFRIRTGEHDGCYGFQVGFYEHSCHVDSTDFIVLFVYTNKHEFEVESYSENWLEKVS